MGRAHGILYGIQVTDGEAWIGDGDSGLLDEYRRFRADDIDAASQRMLLAPWNIERRFVPDTEWDEDGTGRYVGFWISVGASEGGLSGSVDMSRAGVREKYPIAYKNARIRWRRFARWCAAKGIEAEKARLWLLETEVG